MGYLIHAGGSYLGFFCISLFFTWLAEKQFKKQKTKKGMIFCCVAIFCMCWLAGVRSDNVGIDIMYYAKHQFELAQRYGNIGGYLLASGMEPLYSVLVFITAKISKDLFALLFASQLLVLVPVYIVLYKKRVFGSITFGAFIYYFLIYNMSFNIMRQCISAAFLLLAYVLLEERKHKLAIILSFSAMLFHTSAIVIILILLPFKFVSTGKNSVLRRVVFTIIIFALFLNLELVLKTLINSLGILPAVYLERFFNTTQNTDISYLEFSLRGILVAIPFALALKVKNSDKIKDYSYIAFVGYLFSFLVLVSEYLVRVSYYFDFFFLLSVPLVPRYFKIKGYNRLFVYLILCTTVFLYWYVIYICWRWHGTVPFEFR